MAGKLKTSNDSKDVERLKEENRKVVKDCKDQLVHWKKVEKDYESLQERLFTLPDKLTYDVMVPFGPLAFAPGTLVHTNEVTVLLGDNWFAKCSAKQAQTLVHHRQTLVKKKLDDLHKVMKTFKDRADFTDNLEKVTDMAGDFIDIREVVDQEEMVTKGRPRVAHKPNSKPKEEYVGQVEEACGDGKGGGSGGELSEEALWARLDELERLEEEQDERDRLDSTDTNGEETTSSSSEEEKEAEARSVAEGNGHGRVQPGHPVSYGGHGNGLTGQAVDGQDKDEEEDEAERSALPTIYFSHTIEPKKVRINTGKNTTLKFSERKEQKEQAKRKKKTAKCNGHAPHDHHGHAPHEHHGHHRITTPADVYRVFVDVVNGEPVPRKSILKSRSRENSVCSDTSESSAAELEERRGFIGRAHSHEEGNPSDAVPEDDGHAAISLYPNGRFEAFSGTVIEKDPLPSSIPHLTITPPLLPTIPERKQEEVGSEAPQEAVRRVSKFKAARLQQK
ncbi:unconventional prefoldin RPB5 interactor 1 [Brachyhypopomus gauderio]|uniref:unconventional prefoldin RPB5 interactor 1 n=1 Tax=Brachyhypopomus gauderio TaxID=698409 RepID=UPI004041C855